jgi:hypothetical protein
MCMKFQGFYSLYIEIMVEWELKWNVDYGIFFIMIVFLGI